MNKRLVVSIVVVLILVAAFYAYREYNRAPVNTANATPTAVLTGVELIAAFEKDETGATKRYVSLDNVVSIQDTLLKIKTNKPSQPGEKESYTLILGTRNRKVSIRCSMDTTFSTAATTLTPGEPVIVQGICSGYNKYEDLGLDPDIVFVRCSLVKK